MKPGAKTNKPAKSSSRLGTLMTPINSKPQFPAFVPPVLREVGKLAAGVASVSTSQTASGSATGNPRNKVALQPGHSLMDWIRLGTSGKDLTGLGARAGTLSVTRQELAKHNKRDDAWLAIRGKVYNVTEYFPFHPGGEDELMRGTGIDATELFDQVHSWVNYEQILQKCLVGRLVAIDPSIDPEELFFGKKDNASARPGSKARDHLKISSANSLSSSLNPPKSDADSVKRTSSTLPRFDWIQKLDYITVIFYTKAFSNPLVEISYPVGEQTVVITLAYADTIFKNELLFFDKVRWPCDATVTIETGKVELIFKKSDSGIWDNYGVLKQHSNPIDGAAIGQSKSTYILKKKNAVNYNTWLLNFDREEKIIFPLGHHVRVFGVDEISRSYTPVPENLFGKFEPFNNKKDSLCLMIKRYPDGILSKFVTDKNIGDKIQVTRPLGRFDLKVVEKQETFLMLAAGTGITPMLGLILFLLERRIKKCQFIRLLFFNKTENDILFKTQLEELATKDQRFKIDNILSEPADNWHGPRGHVNIDLVSQSLKEHLKDTGYTIKDIFAFVCGPTGFNVAAVEVLKQGSIADEQVHLFEG